MDRKLKLAKRIADSLKLIDTILNDVADDLEELINRLIDTSKETKEDTKPLEQYSIGEE